jgi:UDP-N-acetylmuramoyl-L-alanyl-D-glutamate--2,6-diaminopimelate ligase
VVRAPRPALGVPRPAHVEPVALSALGESAGIGALRHGADLDVTGVTMASGAVQPGDLFAGVAGRARHGASYAAEALAAGAVAVLTDSAGLALVPPGTPSLEVSDVRAVLGPLAAQVYGRPSQALRVCGVTGTSGKTTTTFFVRAGLAAAGVPTGLLGTVETAIGVDAVRAGLTTPEAPDVQALLALMRERGVAAVVMEVSSHAMAMRRADGIEFEVAAFTNLSQDHLDFHTDMDDYFAAKARLFDGRARTPVVIIDDKWGRRMREIAGPQTVTVSTQGADATWRADEIEPGPRGETCFRARGPGIDLRAGCVVPGRYNVANALLALAILDTVGVPADVAALAVGSAVVPGRMERVEAGQPFLAVVDYCHKPAAVDGALRALRPLTTGRLITVLGCGGDRDRAKRPLMGQIAAAGSALLIVTDDNPRSEPPADIRRAMLDGTLAVPAAERADVREIGDRAEAIAAAVRAAGPGDTVLIAGKGHEPGQEIAGVTYPFDDRDVLRAALHEVLA